MIRQTLSVQNLTMTAWHKQEKRTTVQNLSLELKQGKVLALLGASGSGKSMACAGILDVMPAGVSAKYDALLLDNKHVKPAQLRGGIVASILQNPSSAFNPLKNMFFHAKETLKSLGKWDKNAPEKIFQALQEAGLEDRAEILSKYAFEMSGGQLQRMMIALALLCEAPFLIADEPTSDLDLIVQRQILDLIQKLVMERHLGVLLITHDLSVAAKLADEVAVMEQGKIIEQAKVLEIFSHPKQETTKRLLKAHLSLYERAERTT